MPWQRIAHVKRSRVPASQDAAAGEQRELGSRGLPGHPGGSRGDEARDNEQ
ncbi:hypothetical protein [Streptomyces sp. NPDC048357]|uniref:hypothetical protein n=1 Tax=Streptomyces sp. NPDC048357 TaxID=3154719 RepID=UPI003416C56F